MIDGFIFVLIASYVIRMERVDFSVISITIESCWTQYGSSHEALLQQ
jgi:hypothetical protein